MKKSLIQGLSVVIAFVVMLLGTLTFLGNKYEGSVNAALGTGGGSGAVGDGEFTYKSEFTADGKPSDEGMKKLLQAEDEFNRDGMGESAVLVKNNGALPLSDDVKNVTLFGKSMTDPVYRCTSAGPTLDTARLIDPEKAFSAAGYNVNKTLLDAYRADPTKRTSGATQSIGEVSKSFYASALQAGFSDYGDAAIIMFSRLAGEGIDAAKSDADGENQLALHRQEADLLEMVKGYKDRGVFKNVVVLINSAYAMELGWLYDESYGVDAALWIGNPGLTGFEAIPAILKGEYNPSGHFVDTFAESSLSAPATQNMGDTNFAGSTLTYAVYAEGIYVGYKYYETRYEDVVLGRYNAGSEKGTFASSGGWNYADEVVFPFGFGMSYTTFEQTLDEVKWNDDGTIDIKVTIKNTGVKAGKSVIEVYAQTPYTDYDRAHGVEKSAIQLLDFSKTELLQPNESKSYDITADRYLLASWDSSARGGKGGYILDGGDYYIAIGNNAHDALNNILAAKGADGLTDEWGNAVNGNADKAKTHNIAALDETTYSKTEAGNEVSNKFTGLFASDYNDFFEDGVTYMTRSDWNTFPARIENLAIDERMKKIRSGDFYEELKSLMPTPKNYASESNAGIKFIDMKDVEWTNEEKWTQFLGQLSIGEMALVIVDSWGQKAVTSVSKPPNYQCDGPDGGSAKYKYGDKGNNTTYVNQGTMSCSWNKELFERRGELLAEDGLYNVTSVTMGPGVDIHRSPYSGRNHEYYSEDSVFSYIMGAKQCKAMQDKGTIAMLKHLCGNDQETNRKGVCEFMTEQTLREVCLKGFEGCMVKGGAMSAMAAFNCLGVCNAARNKALLTDVVRGEWDWKGFIDTDANDCVDTPTLCVVSGIDMFCLTSGVDKTVARDAASDSYALEALNKTNKRFYYAHLRSNLINGMTRDTVVGDNVPWWKIALVVLDVVTGVIAAAAVALNIFMIVTKKDGLFKKEAANEQA